MQCETFYSLTSKFSVDKLLDINFDTTERAITGISNCAQIINYSYASDLL